MATAAVMPATALIAALVTAKQFVKNSHFFIPCLCAPVLSSTRQRIQAYSSSEVQSCLHHTRTSPAFFATRAAIYKATHAVKPVAKYVASGRECGPASL